MTLHRRGGDVVSARFSPVRQTLAHVFLELVHFGIFPHPRLQLDVLLTVQEEVRVPPTERSSWRKKYSVEERTLITVHQHVKLKSAADLWKALDLILAEEFTTAADFCFDRKNNQLIVPDMLEGTLTFLPLE